MVVGTICLVYAHETDGNYTFHPIFETLDVEWRNLTPRFVVLSDVITNLLFCGPVAEDEDSQDEDEADAGVSDTSRVEEIPPKEPLFNAVPLKSALKKRPAPAASPSATPLATPLAPRQDHHHASFKSV